MGKGSVPRGTLLLGRDFAPVVKNRAFGSWVAGSRGSTPVSAPSTAAASATVRPWIPTVSCVCEMGTTPARLVRPTVGFIPTTPLAEAGLTIEPLVSVPSAAAQKLADVAAAEPELEPLGLRVRT